MASPSSCISLTIGAGSMSCSAPAALPIKAISHRDNEDGTTTIEIEFDLAPREDDPVLTRAAVQQIIDQNYERVHNLVERSHVSSARSVNTVTQRYTNKAVKAIYKRESSFTESEPSDLEVKIPSSPEAKPPNAQKRKQPDSDEPQKAAKRTKQEN
ncbi:hypothetical protein AURDEDRAFT_118250 [Auricularia subglabra TFB-10046 SS5]|nr:hypothetical protein AURDEDRAFT_118250 [Auricularia subglabra TFB-10046 SS5]